MEPTLKSKKLIRERWNLLVRLKRLLNTPMTVLAFIWLTLTVIELTKGLPPGLVKVVTVIWIIFWVHFLLEFFLAPRKILYLKHNWLTLISLILPAVRVLRVVKFIRYATLIRGTSVIRILSSINRGMNALAKSFGRRGILYVFSLTILIITAGAAGIMFFERDYTDYYESYTTALWWTSMMVTTMGTDYLPKSSEGRLLALLLAIYGFAIFGYVTATVASLFIDKDKMSAPPQDEGLKALQSEIRELRKLIGEGRSHE